MRKGIMYLVGGAIAAVTALVAIQPASALPFANGSFTIVPQPGAGSVTVNTGNITLATSSKHEPTLVVQAVDGNLGLAIAPNAIVTLSNATLAVLPASTCL